MADKFGQFPAALKDVGSPSLKTRAFAHELQLNALKYLIQRFCVRLAKSLVKQNRKTGCVVFVNGPKRRDDACRSR